MNIGIRASIAMAAPGVAGRLSVSWSQLTPPIRRAHFDANGAVDRPAGYRSWWHIGTRIKPAGINIPDGQRTKGFDYSMPMSSQVRWLHFSKRDDGPMEHKS